MSGKSLGMDETDLVKGLRKGEVKAFEEVYRLYFKMVSAFIQNNSGTDDDAKDVFQEMLFVLVKKLRQSDFELTAKLGTYIYAVIRHMWLKKLRKNSAFQITDTEEVPMAITDNEIEIKQTYEQKHELMAKVLHGLKEDCKKIILLSFYEKKKHVEIAEIMSITAAFVRVKLHRCMEGFRKQVRNHPDFKDLNN